VWVLWRKDVLKIAAIWFLLPSLIAFGQSRTEAEEKAILQKAERL
jgi:hypothetical protein